MNSIMNVMQSIKLTDTTMGVNKHKNCKMTYFEVLMLRLCYPFFFVKDPSHYGGSALGRLFACGKDIFYRLQNNGNIKWHDVLYCINRQILKKISKSTEAKESAGIIYLAVDDSDIPIFSLSVWLIILRFTSGRSYGVPSPMLSILFLGSIILLVEIARSLLKVSNGSIEHLTLLKREDMPDLFNMIEDVAHLLDVPVPQKVYLSPFVSASVFLSTSSTLFFSPKNKRLEIGVGLINILSKDELKAVIAHELGHFSQKSMFLNGYVYSIGQAVCYVREHVDFQKRGLYDQQLRLFVYLFRIMVSVLFTRLNRNFKTFSLGLELEADRFAVECVGAEALKSALCKVSFAKGMFDDVMCLLANWANQGKAVSNIYSAHIYAMEAFVSNMLNKRIDLSSFDDCLDELPVSSGVSERLKYIDCNKGVLSDTCERTAAREYIRHFGDISEESTSYLYEHVYNRSLETLEICSLFAFRKWIESYYCWMEENRSQIIKRQVIIHLKPRMHHLPWIDASLHVYIDKKEAGKGTFFKGIELSKEISTGKHRLSLICWDNCFMDEEVNIEEETSDCRMELDYSVKILKGVYSFFVHK